MPLRPSAIARRKQTEGSSVCCERAVSSRPPVELFGQPSNSLYSRSAVVVNGGACHRFPWPLCLESVAWERTIIGYSLSRVVYLAREEVAAETAVRRSSRQHRAGEQLCAAGG